MRKDKPAVDADIPVAAKDQTEELSRVHKLCDAGDWRGAEALLKESVSRDGASVAERMLYARVLLRQEKTEEALAAAVALCAAFPKNKAAPALRARILVRLNRVAEAAEYLISTIERFPEEAALHALLAETHAKAGRVQAALQSINQARKLDHESEDHKLWKLVILTLAGKPQKAEMLLKSVENAPDDLASNFLALVSHYTRDHREPEALALAEKACALMPGDLEIRLALADRLLAADRPQDVVATLDAAKPAAEPPRQELTVRALKLKARALHKLRDLEGASLQFQELLALVPDDKDALRDLYVLNQKLGRIEEMKAYGQRLAGSGAKALPDSLAEGLAALQGGKSDGKTPLGRIDWAWSLADKSVWTRESWDAQVRWGRQADNLLRAWWLTKADRTGEIDALIDVAKDNVIDCLPEGTRCLAVTTHLGPMAGNVRFFQSRKRPFRGFGFNGPDPVSGDGPPMRIAAGQNNPGNALRQLIEQVESGTLVGFAQDSPDTDGLALEFLGRRVRISTLVPRLVARHGAVSVWCQSLWKDGRIVVETERLPAPEADEPRDAWCLRWCTAYLTKMEPVMRGVPENLNLKSGIWANTDARFAQ